MATKPYKTTWVIENEVLRVTWTGLQNGDDGSPFAGPDFADGSVQMTGTPGVGGSATIEGSNDGATYAPLTDPQGNDLVLTAAKVEAVSELVAQKRPRVTAGDGATLLNFIMILRKGK